jgi:tetratricopeptide (TPR) repeat protein
MRAGSSTGSAAHTSDDFWRKHMAAKWAKFPHPSKSFEHDAAGLKKHWARLHKGDCEPFPKDAAVVDAWRAFHAGDFAKAVETGHAAGGAGINAAVKAQTVYATYLEKADKAKIALCEEAAGWAQERRADAPKDANAHYLYAFALGRYGQGISVAKALAQGFGGKIKDALLTTIKLQPKHADAHTAYGSYQAEVVAKVGGLVAGMTYGAKKDSALDYFAKALKLNPESAIAHIEYANGLILLFGKARLDEATKLYEAAAACQPADAMEQMDVALARSELE